MKSPGLLDKHRPEVDSELRAILGGKTIPLYDMMQYHFGWIDGAGRPTNGSSGKALRPALCLFACEAVGGDYRKALPAAAALELVHNFSLIHDDIQDDDRERHHRPTVWAVWGKPQAINAGTAMRIMANVALQRLGGDGLSVERQYRINQLLDEITLKLIEGQYLDISYENRLDVSVADYIKMIEGKTAALISGSMEMGANIGTPSHLPSERLAGTGHCLGLAFQIRDDILGIWGKQAETGKPTGNDIRNKKKSFPIVYALEKADNAAKKQLSHIYQKYRVEEDDVQTAISIFESCGARDRAQQLVKEYGSQALKTFESLQAGTDLQIELEELIGFLTSRDY
jgi:geranylgeranyl diphosphate synthase, type I